MKQKSQTNMEAIDSRIWFTEWMFTIAADYYLVY